MLNSSLSTPWTYYMTIYYNLMPTSPIPLSKLKSADNGASRIQLQQRTVLQEQTWVKHT